MSHFWYVIDWYLYTDSTWSVLRTQYMYVIATTRAVPASMHRKWVFYVSESLIISYFEVTNVQYASSDDAHLLCCYWNWISVHCSDLPQTNYIQTLLCGQVYYALPCGTIFCKTHLISETVSQSIDDILMDASRSSSSSTQLKWMNFFKYFS